MEATVSNPPRGWWRPKWRHAGIQDTYMKPVSRDVQPFNLGNQSAWHRATALQIAMKLNCMATPLYSSKTKKQSSRYFRWYIAIYFCWKHHAMVHWYIVVSSTECYELVIRPSLPQSKDVGSSVQMSCHLVNSSWSAATSVYDRPPMRWRAPDMRYLDDVTGSGRCVQPHLWLIQALSPLSPRTVTK